ncbi:hypothetical protein [Henriciella sp.]|uniref:hypothetical protein n=1 Tax=Henriciella sp. TaxID=1968823 RepID=UPI002603BFF6|nr:hypothetical protein [Henriciella sp.]
MKALTFASVLAVSMAGVACSQQAQAPDAADASETANENAQPETSQFNLRYSTGDTQPASSPASSGQFNLRGPDSTQQSPDGFRLPEGAVRENALNQVPEVQTPNFPAQEGSSPVEPEQDPAETPDDDLIRLD